MNITLAYIVDRVTEKYGRVKASVKARLVGDLNMWINRACRRYSFWFLKQDPGLGVIGSFPLTATDFSTLPLNTVGGITQTQWVDKGWLVALTGVASYPYAFPSVETIDVSEQYLVAPITPSIGNSSWVWGEIARLLYVKQFDATGCFVRDLPCEPYDEFMTYGKWDILGTPDRAAFQTANGRSIIHFHPTPDQNYLYQISTRLASLPPLDRADSTNAFLMYCPEVAIAAGLLIYAQYFHEAAEIQYYTELLYGAEYGKLMDPTKATPGGLIGEVLSDSRGRKVSISDQMRVYTSSRRALGRDTGRTKTRYPFEGYYGPL